MLPGEWHAANNSYVIYKVKFELRSEGIQVKEPLLNSMERVLNFLKSIHKMNMLSGAT